MANGFSNRIGVTIEEGVANGTRLSNGVNTRNIGMLTERMRGVANKPFLITSLKEDKKYFGENNPKMYSSYVIESLFNNTGGYPVNLYQARVVGEGSEPATATILSTDPVGMIQVTPLTSASSVSVDFKDYTVNKEVEVVVKDSTLGKSYTFSGSNANTTELVKALDSWLKGLSINIKGKITDNRYTFIGNSSKISVSVKYKNLEGTEICKVYAGQRGHKDVGTWGNDLRVRFYPQGNPNGSQDGYSIQVFYKGYLVETHISKGKNWADMRDKVNSRSSYIMLEMTALDIDLVNVVDMPLTGGAYVSPKEKDFIPRYEDVTEEPKGMAVFDNVDVQILSCPEVFTTNFARQCDDYARKNLKHFIFNMPYLATESTVEDYYNTLNTIDQSFTSGYLEWCQVPIDAEGNKAWIPSIGYVLGAGYIRKAGLNNGYVWTPPAGVETNAKGIFQFTHLDLNEERKSRYVKVHRCNVMQYVNNVGFCLYSSRTYSNHPLFESTHIRLETNWILKNLEIINAKYNQRILSPTLMKTIRNDNFIWFKNIYEKGGIEQSIALEDAVIINIEQDKENRKEAEMDIAWIPPECLEHLHIKLNRNDGSLIVNI